jgi:hypothetical protein
MSKGYYDMRKIASLLLTVASLIMVGCGTPMPNAYSVGSQYVPQEIPQESALVYIFSRNAHIAAPCYVSENGVKVGVIKAGTYFTRSVKPGKYEYVATNDSHIKSPVTIITEAGKEYFIEVRQESDFLAAHAYADVVQKESANTILPFLYLIKYNKD